MLVVPNHHVIVPKTYDLYFFMPNKITTTQDTRRGGRELRILGSVREVYCNFNIKSPHFVEVYAKEFRPYKGFRLFNYGNYAGRVVNSFQDFWFDRIQASGMANFLDGGYLRFANVLRGPVRIFYDTVDRPIPEYTKDPAKKGLVINFTNIQSYNYYDQRFNPGNYARGRAKLPLESNVHPTGEYNTEMWSRVGDAIYAEPIAITQPLWGYVRPTHDRQGLLYVPYRNFQGTDAFTYTLLNQQNQMGMPKTITIDVFGNAPPISYTLTSDYDRVYPGSVVNIILTTVSVPPESVVPFFIYGTGINYIDFDRASAGINEINFTTLRGNFVVELDETSTGNNVCRAVLPLRIAIDEDAVNEVFTVELREFDYTPVTCNVVIVVLDLLLSSNKATMFEGEEVEFSLELVKFRPTQADIPDGTDFPYVIEYGQYNTSTGRFVGNTVITSGYFTTVNNRARTSYIAPFDNDPGPTKYAEIRLTAFNLTSRANVAILDLYNLRLTSSADTVYEGDQVDVTLTVSGIVPDGTAFEYELIYGLGVTPQDFTPAPISAQGTFITLARQSRRRFLLAMDEKLEPGPEIFQVRLRKYPSIITSITILDRYRGLKIKPDAEINFEGGIVTFYLLDENNGFPDGTSFEYEIEFGTDNATQFVVEDVYDPTKPVNQRGTFTLRGGQASRSYFIRVDNFTEPSEKFIIRLVDYPDIYAGVTILDAVKEILLYADNLTVNEGDQVTFHVLAPYLHDDTVLVYRLVLTNMTLADFWPHLVSDYGTFVIKNGRAERTFELQADWLTEGSATMKMQLVEYPTISRTVTITDRMPQVNSFYVDRSVVVEGDTVTFRVAFTNSASVSRVRYQIVPWTPLADQPYSTIDVYDLDPLGRIPLSGNINVYNYYGELPITIYPDYKEEIPELFSVILPDYPGFMANVIVRDVSNALMIISDKDTVSEGDSITFILTGNPDVEYILPNNAVYDFEILLPSRSITDYDFERVFEISKGLYQGTFVARNNFAIRTFFIAEDMQTEGPETLTIRLKDFPQVYKTVIIEDTSQGQGRNLMIGTSVSSINEGGSLTVSIYSGDLPAGTVITYTVDYRAI